MANPKKRSADSGPLPSKSKKRKTKSSHDDEALDTELGVNTLIGRMDSQLLADHLAQKTSRFGTQLSTVELSDLAVPASCIRDTSSWQETRTLEHLPAFLEAFAQDAKDLTKAPKQNGSPHTLIVAGAGLRAADIVRAVRKFSGKDNAVAKLFAKHIKVDEQVAFLTSRKTGIGVGTPARLMELMDNGALSLDKLQRLVVDASHIDQKKRGVLDMKDTMMPLARFLTRRELKSRYDNEKKRLALLFY